MLSRQEITGFLRKAADGDREALDEVFSTVYEELHRLARSQRRRWEGNHTLNTTSLIHEAYLKLVNQDGASWKDLSHFLAVAARAMRHVLVNYAQAKRAAKRGGGREPVSLEHADPISSQDAEQVLALHEALERLESVNQRQVRVVEARFFGGFTIEDTAEILGVSPATVKRDWALASAWLFREMKGSLS